MYIFAFITISKTDEGKFTFNFRSNIKKNETWKFCNYDYIEGGYIGEKEAINLWKDFQNNSETFLVKGTYSYVKGFIQGFTDQIRIMINYDNFQKKFLPIEESLKQLDSNPNYIEPILMDTDLNEEFRSRHFEGRLLNYGELF